MSVYADTSFIASLYIPDANSPCAAKIMQVLPLPVMLTQFGELEFVNALHLRLFRKEMRQAEVRATHAAFRADLHAGVFAVHALPDAAFTHALRLAAKWTVRLGTRSLDIIHVAAAVVLHADTFQTFDDRQRALAKAAKLKAG